MTDVVREAGTGLSVIEPDIDHAASEREPARPPFRRIKLTICYLAVAVSALSVLLVLAAWRDDHIISSHLGTATAEVLSAGRLRSTISFVTPDGQNRNPKLGVLYPTNLTAGQSIDVEYATNDPELVRVAGRDVQVALIPAGSVIAITWAIAAAALLALRRAGRKSGPGRRSNKHNQGFG